MSLPIVGSGILWMKFKMHLEGSSEKLIQVSEPLLFSSALRLNRAAQGELLHIDVSNSEAENMPKSVAFLQ